jgi:two-component sensor histidine kinase
MLGSGHDGSGERWMRGCFGLVRNFDWRHALPFPSKALYPLHHNERFMKLEDGRALAQAIVDTIREPLLVLDENLHVVAANRSFYLTFEMDPNDVRGCPVHSLGEGEWNIPELRLLLEKILPQHAVMESYEVEQDFVGSGRRIMLLNARTVFDESHAGPMILLAMEDVTEWRAAEREMKALMQQKEVLLQEMQHRVANSLQIIASILLLKARTVHSEESRLHLHDAHQRVISVAAVQQQLLASARRDPIELGSYLSRLCETLAASMIGDTRPITLKVHAESGTASSDEAVSIGLIVTELVINALKHAFLHDKADGRIIVAYEVAEAGWRLAVSDNGGGKASGIAGESKPGLGTSIVEALGHQLGARVEVLSGPQGTQVSITRGTFTSRPADAA